jgi:hypothetical protein
MQGRLKTALHVNMHAYTLNSKFAIIIKTTQFFLSSYTGGGKCKRNN